jgi:asparagine synthase (glutamine-hydrolysing)
MCRIAGLLNPSFSIPALEETVTNMCNLLKHGGPDDGGIFTEASCNLTLGNRRLALLDLTVAGHQPMQYGNRYTITYNGEIYNYKTLRAELQTAGVNFTTGTDTEVILAAFEKWNTASFSKFNGMFAFALWDAQVQKLYLVRDSAGIKPLYYSTHAGGLAFASEMRAFVAINYLQEKNKDASVYQLAYGFIPEPVTTLANVVSLPKGCFLCYNVRQQTSSVQTFAFYSFSNSINDETTATKKIYNTIDDAVQSQLLADAKVGMFLSGGIDSSIIASLANKQKDKELHTLSIYFNEENYSEKKYQDIIAHKIVSKHHSILLTEANFNTHFEEIINAMDMPSCDGINTWFISKFAADNGLKAVLSGVGADELFGGYPSFNRINKAIFLQKTPNFLLSMGSQINQTKYSRLSYLKMDGMRGLYLFLRGHFTPHQIAKQLGTYEKDVWNVLEKNHASPIFKNIENKNKASWLEYNYYMQDQLLRDADVMSMTHGVEIRVPFLDNNVISTAFCTNEKLKYKTNMPKGLLVNTFKDILPTEIWDRPKMGFSFPFAEWLKKSPFLNILAESNNVEAKKALSDFIIGKLHWSRILSLILIEKRLHF